MDPNAMLTGRTRETQIRRDASGRWWNGDDPISHPNLVEAFNAWIDRADDGRYCLRNDINWAYIALEGPPIFVRMAAISGDHLRLQLSDGREETLETHSLRVGPEQALYCDVREGRLVARFTREASMALADILREDESGLYLDLGGQRVRPREVDDPLAPL